MTSPTSLVTCRCCGAAYERPRHMKVAPPRRCFSCRMHCGKKGRVYVHKEAASLRELGEFTERRKRDAE